MAQDGINDYSTLGGGGGAKLPTYYTSPSKWWQNPAVIAGGAAVAGYAFGGGDDSGDDYNMSNDPFADLRGRLGTAAERAGEQVDEATAAAEAHIAESVAQATWFLEQGEQKGAAAAIEGARKAADAIMKSADQGESAVREFWNKANEALAPVVRQGNFGRDEMASMLGIPNAKGELVPFNDRSLSETPGYRFRLNEGQRALENSAVGTALSGAQVKGSIEFGQGLASEYFNKRVDQLGLLAQMGLTASQSQAQAATQAGANISQLRSNAGGQLGNAYTGEATSLANIYQQTGTAQSNNYMTAGSAMSELTQNKGLYKAGLTTDLATTGANLSLAEYQGRQSLNTQKKDSKLGIAGGAATGAAIGNMITPGVGAAWGAGAGAIIGGLGIL